MLPIAKGLIMYHAPLTLARSLAGAADRMAEYMAWGVWVKGLLTIAR